MQKKSIAVNYILNTTYQILILIVPLITTPYISRVLGAEGIGVYSYTYSVVSYFLIVAAMGTTTYGQRTIAYYQDDKYKRSCKFFEILLFRALTTGVCSIGYIWYLCSPYCQYNKVATIQIIYLIAIAFDISWLFQGLEDFKRIVLRNTIAKIFNVVLILTVVKQAGDVDKYTFILAGMTFVANISVWPYVPKIIQKVKLSDVKPLKNTREIFLLFIPTIAIQVNAVLDKTMIGGFAISAAENGYYEQTEKIVRMALAVVTSLGTVMIPRIAKLFHDKKTEQMRQYSIHDALEAGFNHVVFIIRKDIEQEFKEVIGERIKAICAAHDVTVDYAFQDINDIPGTLPEGRTKPWGTGQAVLAAKKVIKTPFIVINADDYYGKEGFKAVHEYLVNGGKSCMAGFVLKNTLSDNGGVTRGICKMDEDYNLTEVVETKNIVKTVTGAEAEGMAVDVDSLVSMNMWGLTPDFLTTLEEGFKEFFEKEVPGNPLKAEYLIPIFIGELLEHGKISVKVLKTNDTWYGMTYHEDVAAVKDSFKRMLENGVYKADLFSDL